MTSPDWKSIKFFQCKHTDQSIPDNYFEWRNESFGLIFVVEKNEKPYNKLGHPKIKRGFRKLEVFVDPCRLLESLLPTKII